MNNSNSNSSNKSGNDKQRCLEHFKNFNDLTPDEKDAKTVAFNKDDDCMFSFQQCFHRVNPKNNKFTGDTDSQDDCCNYLRRITPPEYYKNNVFGCDHIKDKDYKDYKYLDESELSEKTDKIYDQLEKLYPYRPINLNEITDWNDWCNNEGLKQNHPYQTDCFFDSVLYTFFSNKNLLEPFIENFNWIYYEPVQPEQSDLYKFKIFRKKLVFLLSLYYHILRKETNYEIKDINIDDDIFPNKQFLKWCTLYYIFFKIKYFSFKNFDDFTGIMCTIGQDGMNQKNLDFGGGDPVKLLKSLQTIFKYCEGNNQLNFDLKQPDKIIDLFDVKGFQISDFSFRFQILF